MIDDGVVEFFVPGPPRAWARARSNGNRFFTDPKTRAWKNLVRVTAMRSRWVELYESPVRVSMIFQMPRPKKDWSAKGGVRPSAPTHHTKKPDPDNLSKGVLDALNGLAYVDDAQVVELSARKVYAERPGDEGVLVRVEAVA